MTSMREKGGKEEETKDSNWLPKREEEGLKIGMVLRSERGEQRPPEATVRGKKSTWGVD